MGIKGIFLRTGVLLVLLGSAGVATAQIKVQTKPSDKLFLMKLEDNTVLAVDGVSRRFYRTDLSGATFEVSFEEAAQQAEADPVKRAALISNLESNLANSVNSIYLETGFPLGVPSEPDPTYPCNPVCEVQMISPVGTLNSATGSVSDDDIKDLEEVPVIGRRPVRLTDGGGGVFWSDYRASYNFSSPIESGGYITREQLKDYDYQKFRKEQVASCNSVQLKGAVALAAVGINLATCATAAVATPATGGLAAKVIGPMCFAQMITTVAAIAEYAQADATCSASYPGLDLGSGN